MLSGGAAIDDVTRFLCACTIEGERGCHRRLRGGRNLRRRADQCNEPHTPILGLYGDVTFVDRAEIRQRRKKLPFTLHARTGWGDWSSKLSP
jgi:hypothetical protein